MELPEALELVAEPSKILMLDETGSLILLVLELSLVLGPEFFRLLSLSPQLLPDLDELP